MIDVINLNKDSWNLVIKTFKLKDGFLPKSSQIDLGVFGY